MVDVVVDQKPMAKLPYDPEIIPKSVRDRAAAVDALYANKPDEPPKSQPEPQSQPEPEKPSESASDSVSEPVPDQGEAPIPQASAPVVESSPSVQPTSADSSKDENSDSWKHRYLAMQGRYNASQKTLGEMQEQMTQLGNELLQIQRAASKNGHAAPLSSQPSPVYLTEQDVQNYGSELVDFTQRAAAQAVAPKFREIEQQNAELRKRLAEEARFRLDQAVELAVPNYREIDKDPRWHRWLLGVDLLSGYVRQQLLNEAIAAANAPRVISFFRGFQHEEAATGHIEPAPVSQQAAPPREAAIPLASLAAPGRARPATGGDASVPLDRPTYTRAQIAKLYADHRRGAYVGREVEWARQEADLYTAQREGRVRT